MINKIKELEKLDIVLIITYRIGFKQLAVSPQLKDDVCNVSEQHDNAARSGQLQRRVYGDERGRGPRVLEEQRQQVAQQR